MASLDEEYGDEVATAAVREPSPPTSALTLRVLGEGFSASYPLPATGSLVLGRSERADIRLENASVSRRHAVLHLGAQLAIEDLGSANGTQVGGQRLGARSRHPITPGEVLEVGSMMLVVQAGLVSWRPRRLWSHEYFEGRLDEECGRAARAHRAFSILRVSIDRPGATAAHELIAAALQEEDLVATYAPNEYEVLLPSLSFADAQRMRDDVLARLRTDGAAVRAAVACYPRDGQTAHALVASIGRSVHGLGTSAAEPAKLVEDGAMQRLHRLIDRLAAGNISVLLLGETGVGKEVLAETLHQRSPRAAQPLLRLHCAALTETLLESELFGHEKGAFTGATSSKQGLLESADGGSVFLDEVGELPMALQAKLLRVLEDRRVTRVGAVKSRVLDVRFISATNRNLEEAAARGTFRQDLYYRLSGMSLVIPPLRERTSEIEALAHLFITRFCGQINRSEPAVPAVLLERLKRYSWPGNIRELRNVIERAVLLCTGDTLLEEHVILDKMGATLAAPASPRSDDELDRRRVLEALDQCAGNQTQAAKLLGISRGTLVARLDAYSLPRPRKKPQRPA